MRVVFVVFRACFFMYCVLRLFFFVFGGGWRVDVVLERWNVRYEEFELVSMYV